MSELKSPSDIAPGMRRDDPIKGEASPMVKAVPGRIPAVTSTPRPVKVKRHRKGCLHLFEPLSYCGKGQKQFLAANLGGLGQLIAKKIPPDKKDAGLQQGAAIAYQLEDQTFSWEEEQGQPSQGVEWCAVWAVSTGETRVSLHVYISPWAKSKEVKKWAEEEGVASLIERTSGLKQQIKLLTVRSDWKHWKGRNLEEASHLLSQRGLLGGGSPMERLVNPPSLQEVGGHMWLNRRPAACCQGNTTVRGRGILAPCLWPKKSA
ncbi:uncharacterized protein LOC133388423 [Rhineura floridana]|uniref:uncharacterized protein LOC133388423 n=1 Tax=Rhineura floridana TaxID=261503 RepID=UPI002AC8149B|nr:uncharacterized protein LOC133388423 [Rhineura floridana]